MKKILILLIAFVILALFMLKSKRGEQYLIS